MSSFDLTFKLIIIGDTGTGKSCCLHYFVEGKNREGGPKHTIGVEFGSRVVLVGGNRIKLQLWDTAGQERFRAVTRSYYRGAAGAIVVYDITSEETFAHVATWVNDARTLASADVAVMIVGNKADLDEDREVTKLQGAILAQDLNAHFLEASAERGDNVSELFTQTARMVLSKIESGHLLEHLVPSDTEDSRDDGDANQKALRGGPMSWCFC